MNSYISIDIFALPCEGLAFDLHCQCDVCRLQREETDARRVAFLKDLSDGDSEGENHGG